MKTLAILLCLVSSVVFAQVTVPGATATQQTAARLDAAVGVVESVVAAGSQATVTVPALSGYYCYIVSIELYMAAIAAPAATLMQTTTTNLNAKSWRHAMQAAVGADRVTFTPSAPLKCQAIGTAATVVGNAGVTSISQQISVTYYYAQQ